MRGHANDTAPIMKGVIFTTRYELQFLRIGDRVVINKGKNKGRVVTVLDILGSDDESPCILIKTLDLEPFIEGGNTSRRFKLTGWRELDVIN